MPTSAKATFPEAMIAMGKHSIAMVKRLAHTLSKSKIREEITCRSLHYPVLGTPHPLRLVELSEATMSRLLKPHARSQTTSGESELHGAELLRAIRDLDTWTANRLGSRTANLEKFRFKVVVQSPPSSASACPANPPGPMPLVEENCSDTEIPDSYVAISYCWHGDAWSPALGLQTPSSTSAADANLPLMPAMFSAVLDERSSASEPLWLDQWCINQSDEQEKQVAVSMMDLVYSEARKVVVCLEDVRLTAENMSILLDFAEYLDQNGIESADLEQAANWNGNWGGKEGYLWEAVTKVFSARWFQRAWCAHEYWLGRNHVFLVPVTRDPEGPVPEDRDAVIVRFDSKFLGLAHFFSSCWIPGDEVDSAYKQIRHVEEHVKSTHSYYWEDCFDIGNSIVGQESKVAFIHAWANHGHAWSSTVGVEEVTQDRSTLIQQTFAVVDTLGAKYTSDKLTITLNVAQTGLYLKDTQKLSASEIAWIATIIALASGDATVLASTGPPIVSVGNKCKEETSWAHLPEIDKYSRLDPTSIEKGKGPLVISEKGLEISVLHLGSSSHIQAPDEVKRWLAEAAVEYLFDWAQLPSKFSPGTLCYRHLVQAVACLLTGGVEWTLCCAAQVRLHGLDPLRYFRLAASRTEIEGAFRALNMVVFSTESGSQGCVDALGQPVPFNMWATQWILHQKQQEENIVPSLKALVTVAEGLLRTVMGEHNEYFENAINETYKLQVCVRSPEDLGTHGGIVIFAPPASHVEYHLVCPEVLRFRRKPQPISGMAKGWLLQTKTAAGRDLEGIVDMEEYGLLGKTRLFMPLTMDGDPLEKYPSQRVIVN